MPSNIGLGGMTYQINGNIEYIKANFSVYRITCKYYYSPADRASNTDPSMARKS